MIQTIDNTENIHRKEDTDSKTVTQPDDQIEQGAILIEHPQGNGGENNTIANSDDDNEDNNPEASHTAIMIMLKLFYKGIKYLGRWHHNSCREVI